MSKRDGGFISSSSNESSSNFGDTHFRSSSRIKRSLPAVVNTTPNAPVTLPPLRKLLDSVDSSGTKATTPRVLPSSTSPLGGVPPSNEIPAFNRQSSCPPEIMQQPYSRLCNSSSNTFTSLPVSSSSSSFLSNQYHNNESSYRQPPPPHQNRHPMYYKQNQTTTNATGSSQQYSSWAASAARTQSLHDQSAGSTQHLGAGASATRTQSLRRQQHRLSTPYDRRPVVRDTAVDWQSMSRKSTATATKGGWSQEEDELLVKLATENGARNWNAVSKSFEKKTAKQCRDRWHNQVNPEIKNKPWSSEEDQMLLDANEELGNRWSEIARLFPGRTPNSIKNHYNSSLRPEVRQRRNLRKKAGLIVKRVSAGIIKN